MQPRGLEVNGGLVWAVKYIDRWRQHIEELTLFNPSLAALKMAVSLPRLTSLTIKYKANVYKPDYVVPALPCETPPCPSLTRLTFCRDVSMSSTSAIGQHLRPPHNRTTTYITSL